MFILVCQIRGVRRACSQKRWVFNRFLKTQREAPAMIGFAKLFHYQGITQENNVDWECFMVTEGNVTRHSLKGCRKEPKALWLSSSSRPRSHSGDTTELVARSSRLSCAYLHSIRINSLDFGSQRSKSKVTCQDVSGTPRGNFTKMAQKSSQNENLVYIYDNYSSHWGSLNFNHTHFPTIST